MKFSVNCNTLKGQLEAQQQEQELKQTEVKQDWQ